MVAMNGEHRNRHIDVLVVVVNMIEGAVSRQSMNSITHGATDPAKCSLPSLSICSSQGLSP